MVGTKTDTRFYINGEPQEEFTVNIESSDGELNIGSFKLAQGNSRNWIGKMDEIYLLDTALAESDIQKFIGFELGNENLLQKDIIVYPNPAQQYLHIDGISGKYQVSIYSLKGQIVYSVFVEAGKISVSISKLPKGMYLLKLRN